MKTPENILNQNSMEQEINPVMQENIPKSIEENHKKFMADIEARMQNPNPEEMQNLLTELERYSQLPDRRIEVYTDPELPTFCCAQVASKKVNAQGDVVDDPVRKTYLIGVPFQYIAGRADLSFLRGEILHEQGHAVWTDFSRWNRFKTLANSQGYNPQELTELDNCIEDPRMERLVGGPTRESQRLQLLAKNEKLIIPYIAEGIRGVEGKEKMSPTEQFKLILKIERLWALHQKDLEGVEKPWSLDDLHPRVREEYEKIVPLLAKITGDSVRPAMKVNLEVEEIIVNNIWPSLRKLIDEFPDKVNKNEQGKQGKEGKDRKEGGKKGESSNNPPPPESQNLNPSDPSSWTPELQKILQKMIEKHEKRLDGEAEQVKKNAEKKSEEHKKIEQKLHELQKIRDGFESPELREKYNEIKKEVSGPINQLRRIFDRLLPIIDEPQYEWGKRGIRFSVKNFVRSFGTGSENPMGKRKTPEKNALVLQILLDVSGSMYGQRSRIENAIKACVALGEAAQKHNINLEILANDDGNYTDDYKYVVKDFTDGFDASVKSRIIGVLENKEGKFGGNNKDANAIDVAIPRLKKMVQKKRVEADRTGSLVIFISDSSTSSIDTKLSADKARLQTPFEGTAITPEKDIAENVKNHFGSDSVIPRSIEDFPAAIQKILERHMTSLKSRQ